MVTLVVSFLALILEKEERRLEVMRKPLITRKTSTPTNPPGREGTSRWKRITKRIERARKPSMSLRYAGSEEWTTSGGDGEGTS